jgi:hypothetical protein
MLLGSLWSGSAGIHAPSAVIRSRAGKATPEAAGGDRAAGGPDRPRRVGVPRGVGPTGGAGRILDRAALAAALDYCLSGSCRNYAEWAERQLGLYRDSLTLWQQGLVRVVHPADGERPDLVVATDEGRVNLGDGCPSDSGLVPSDRTQG